MYEISMCGHFGGDKEFFDGQTIKTKNIYLALLDKYSENEIKKIDTYQWKKHPISFFKDCVKGIKNSKNIIILPAHNGVRVLIPLFLLVNKLYKRKIFYIVIGGWLPEFLEKRKGLLKKVKKLDKVFVETNNMKKQLEKLDVKNVEILVNFKNITPLKEEDLNFNYSKPYKLCTFSRVMKEKGIEDAINVVKKINEDANEIVYKLDIYGPIDESYKNSFEEIMQHVPNYIQYKGCVDSNKSVETLKEYYLLLFPTYYSGEGMAGTLIDAQSAGVPVVASNWKYNNEIIIDKINGYLYETHNLKEFEKVLKEINNSDIEDIKKNCLKCAKKFNGNVAIEILTKELRGKVKL